MLKRDLSESMTLNARRKGEMGKWTWRLEERMMIEGILRGSSLPKSRQRTRVG